MALTKLIILFAVVFAVAHAHGHGGGHGDSSEEEKDCEQPGWISKLDQAIQDKITAIWNGYVAGTNCSTQLEAQKQVFMELHATQLAAKVANLSAEAQTVFNNQIKPIWDNAALDMETKMPQIKAIVDAQTTEIQDELKSLWSKGRHGRRHGGGRHGRHGHHKKSTTTTTVPSA